MTTKPGSGTSGARIRLLWTGLILAMGASGCTEFRLSDEDIAKLSNDLQLAAMFAQCAPPPAPNKGPTTIQIQFVNKGTNEYPVWCPEAPVDNCPYTYNDETVVWAAVEPDGSGGWKPVKTAFTVYFSPFPNGSVKGAKGTGETGPKKLKSNEGGTEFAPSGVYKYTVAPEKVTEDCEALDPNFWVY